MLAAVGLSLCSRIDTNTSSEDVLIQNVEELAMRELRQSTSVDVPIGPFLDSTDGVTLESGLTLTQPDIRLKKNGGAWAQKAAAQTLAYEEGGYYEVTLDATDTGTLGLLRLAVAKTGALPIWEDFEVVTANYWDSKYGADNFDVSVIQWNGGAVTTGAIPSAVAGATGGLFIAGTNAATVVTTSFTSTFTGNLTGSVASVTGAVGSVTGLTASNLDATVSSRLASASYTVPPTAAANATAIWTEAIPGAYGAGSAGSRMGKLPDVTAGGAGGVFIAGTNAATAITTSFTTTFTEV